MTLLGLELSDAGIIVAGDTPPRLLAIDGSAVESPGIALSEKKQLRVGRSAEQKGHLYPHQFMNRFWDQLDTEPFKNARKDAGNNAEIAYAHLAKIWQKVKTYGKEMMIAVPGFYTRDQLGLILAMANELGIVVKGFIPIAVAATQNIFPHCTLMHLDIHLHRFEVAYLKQSERLSHENSTWLQEKGLILLYKQWVEIIADEFVRTTRFDPLHQASTEQELYDRLPSVLSDLKHSPSVVIEMTRSNINHRISLTRDHFIRQSESIFQDFQHLVEQMRETYNKGQLSVGLQLTHRLAALPGIKKKLAELENVHMVELEAGAAALGVLRILDQLSDQISAHGAAYFTSRPWQESGRPPALTTKKSTVEKRQPTHILYRNLAYPLSDKPLYIGCDRFSKERGIQICGQVSGVSKKHCAVQLQGQSAVLTDFSTQETFVDGQRLQGQTTLQLGQVVRVGTPGEELQLIICLDSNEA